MTAPGWYVIIAISTAVFGAIFAYRKAWKKRETAQMATFMALAFVSAVIVESVGVSFDLWHYVGGDWPAILWLTYAITGAAGFQLVSLVRETVRA